MNSYLHNLKLAIVPMEHVRLHERIDPQRVARLVETIKQRGILKNPILVAEDDGHFIVLDGATKVGGRALGLNVPLAILTGPQSIGEKNDWLDEMVSRRRQTNRVRMYAEPTLVFDE